jgi:APA family basic amino acid/polyamine antiporter
MGEEIKYPHINIPRALFLAPFIVFIVNAMFQWYLIGIVPTEQLDLIAIADAPYAEAMAIAGILGFPLIMLAAGIAFGGDFSTINASIAVPPRYLFTMARDGAMPKFLAKLHPKYKTPYVAILVLGLLTVFLITSNSMIYIASLSLFADLFYYVIGITAAIGLRKKHPNLNRPYKAPGIMIGAPVSAIIYIIMMTQLDSEAFWTGVIWCALGLVIFFVCSNRYKSGRVAQVDQLITNVVEPTVEEKGKMDREFKIWRNIVIIAITVVALLYLLPHLI